MTHPYQRVQSRTILAPLHNTYHLNRSELDAIHVPNVWIESFAMTEYAAKANPTIVYKVTRSIILLAPVFKP